MKFWVYTIDWRTRAVSIIAEVNSEEAGRDAIAKMFSECSPERANELAQFFTAAITPVSPDMELVAKKFVRPGEALCEAGT